MCALDDRNINQTIIHASVSDCGNKDKSKLQFKHLRCNFYRFISARLSHLTLCVPRRDASWPCRLDHSLFFIFNFSILTFCRRRKCTTRTGCDRLPPIFVRRNSNCTRTCRRFFCKIRVGSGWKFPNFEKKSLAATHIRICEVCHNVWYFVFITFIMD